MYPPHLNYATTLDRELIPVHEIRLMKDTGEILEENGKRERLNT